MNAPRLCSDWNNLMTLFHFERCIPCAVPFGRCALASAALVACGLLAQTPTWAQTQRLSDVVVSSGKLEQSLFDAPASTSRFDGLAIQASGSQINLSDVLQQVPGVVALNRNNYAQDVQVSIRGFGARSAFGVRGLQVWVDGIPQTTPDGQAQTNIATMGSLGSLQVMTGPLSQIYGNSSGGVIQAFTRTADPGLQGQASLRSGDFGLQRADVQASLGQNALSLVADLSTLDVKGWRDNSEARREQLNTVLTLSPSAHTQWQLSANVFLQPLAQDPLGLTSEQFAQDPAQAGSGALAAKTRKITSQHQVGAQLSTRLDGGLKWVAKAYGGNRDNLQFLSSNKWVSIARDFSGLGLSLHQDAQGQPLQWVIGVDAARSQDARSGGSALGGEAIAGSLNRDEINRAASLGVYGQAQWQGENWGLTAGMRHSEVTISAHDYFLSNGDGSGRVRYRATSPVLGLTRYIDDSWNAYVNWGKGFETPTTVETAYTNTGAATPAALFNPNLKAATSRQLEWGAKWQAEAGSSLKLAMFSIHTDNEIVVDVSKFGSTAYRNAPGTTRKGLEWSGHQVLGTQWTLDYAATWLRASYDRAFAAGVSAGSQMPGIPARQLWSALRWQARDSQGVKAVDGLGASMALEWLARSAMWASDQHAPESRAAGYSQLNWRTAYGFKWRDARIDLSASLNNLADRKAVGSVIVNQSAGQYFEPLLPRHWVFGLQAKLPL